MTMIAEQPLVAETPMSVVARGQLIQFTSPYTNDEALARLTMIADTSRFAADLVAQYFQRGLSARQWPWVHKLVVDAAKPAPAGVDADFAGVIHLFDHAAEHLKYPGLALEVDGIHIELKRAGSKSKAPGAVNITDGGRYGNNLWYGRIERDGTLTPSRQLTDGIRALLLALAAAPAAVAAAYGRKTGNCCFCSRPLTDERSTAVGYGPICAEHWSLPWG
jgi:hypothetical protein